MVDKKGNYPKTMDEIDANFFDDDDDLKDFGLDGDGDNSKNDEEINEDYTIRIFGLDNSGKSTLMMSLINPVEGNVPELSEDFTADAMVYQKANINLFDISGKKTYREYWKNFFHSSDGFIFVIDASDNKRIEEAKIALKSIIQLEDNKDIPLLIYANKIDLLNNKYDVEKLWKDLDLNKSDNIFIQACSSKKLTGLKEGFEWLFKKVKIEY
jgi:small GTP-binding protein